MVFLITDYAKKIKFLKETFYIINVTPDTVFRMFFFNLSDTNINFPKKSFDTDFTL